MIDLDAIRSRLADPEHVAELLQLERSPHERRKWRCPQHGGTSLSLRVGRDGSLQVRCFGCDLSGGIVELVAAVRGLDVRSDFRAVLAEAAELAGVEPSNDVSPRPRLRAVAPPAPPRYPPDAAEWWHSLPRIEADAEVCAYLDGRGLDWRDVQAHGLARVIRPGWPCPPWAAIGGRSWVDAGYKLVAPWFDSLGAIRSVRGWRTDGGTPKRIAPAGFEVRGLALACPTARAMLAGEAAPRKVLVAEGESDVIAASIAYRLRDPERPAVLGVTSGTWTAEIAGRIPRGATVIVATDHDDAGERYAAEIVRTLAGRKILRTKGAA